MKGREAIQNSTMAAGASRRFYRRTRVASFRFLRNSVLALMVLAAIFSGGFGLFALHISALTPPKEIQAADAIIVLTGGRSRLGAALELLRSGKGQRLLISGVNPVADADDLSAATGAERALFTCCVDIDHAAVDTIGNAEESAKWVRANAFDSVILVTSNYHMPRSLLEMRRYVETAAVQPYPVVNTPIGNGGWLTKPKVLRVLFKEYTKYLAAVVRSMLPVGMRQTELLPDESTVASRSTQTAR